MKNDRACFLVIREDTLGKESKPLSGFFDERDALMFIEDLEKKEDNLGLTAVMNYRYKTQMILVHEAGYWRKCDDES